MQELTCFDILERIKKATYVTGIRGDITIYSDTPEQRDGLEMQFDRGTVRSFRCLDWDAKKQTWLTYLTGADYQLSRRGLKNLNAWISEYCLERYHISNPNFWEYKS